MALHSKEVVGLYRRILKLAQYYPSIKRNEIIQDIKLEFREGKLLTDERLIEQRIQSARQGIQELSMYTNLNPSATSWTVGIGREMSSGGVPITVKVVGDNKTQS